MASLSGFLNTDALTQRMGALSQPAYRRYWLGSVASVGSVQLIIVGQGWLIVNELGGSPIDLGYLGAASALPTIAVNTFGGVVADRVNRRMLLVITSTTVMMLLALQALLVISEAVRIWHVVVISAMLGLVFGLEWPTRNAFFPALIRRAHIMSAVALNSILWHGGRVISPAIAGFVIRMFGTGAVFIGGAAGFGAMALVLLSLKTPVQVPPSGRNAVRDLVEGVKFIAKDPLFAVIIPLTYAHHFFGTQHVQLMPLFAKRFDVGAEGLGLMFTISGVGAVVGTLVVGRIQGGRHTGKVMLGGGFLFGLLVLGFALAPTYPVALVSLLIMGMFSSFYLITSMSVLQLRVPDRLRGRVMGIHGITFSLIQLGGLLGGAVAELYDERVAIGLGAVIFMAIVLGVLVFAGHIRSLDGRKLVAARAEAV
ncbi:MAG: MFS transporter [Chloroflexota bacterium]|nr:MFS transporter [Chloroflexota bacterium]